MLRVAPLTCKRILGYHFRQGPGLFRGGSGVWGLGKVVTNEGRARVRGCALASASVLSLAVMCGAAKAQPSGGSVVAGQAQISSSGATTLINQSTSKAIINWQSFSVGQGSSVQFNQPSAGAITLNRVTGTSASVIDGAIRANGQVWLLNPNGLLFGNGATINVAGLLATTSDINDQDFLSGGYNFSSTGGKGAVTNSGTITAGNGGSVVLSSSSVTNKGIIQANAGHVVLGGTDTFTVDFNGDHLLNYAISPNSAGGKVSNSGKIAAAGGTILMTARAAAGVQDAVINNSGMVEATSVRQENGEIILEADNGTVADSGTLDASGNAAGQTGGTVKVLGQQVAVADGAKIDVSGDAGGGTALIGGNLHGAGPEPNAQNTSVGKATINASAITKGNGGTVAVYSTGTTRVAATITAKGGITSGKGGMVETSGHILGVSSDASVNTLAPHGASGDWLLDPNNLTIVTSGTGTANGETFATTTNDTIDPNTIVTALGSGNVTLQANVDITVNTAISTTTTNTLELDAGHSIILNAGISLNNLFTSAGQGSTLILSANDPRGSGNASNASITGTGVLLANNITLKLTGTSAGIGGSGSPLQLDYTDTSTDPPLSLTVISGGNVYLTSQADSTKISAAGVNVGANIFSLVGTAGPFLQAAGGSITANTISLQTTIPGSAIGAAGAPLNVAASTLSLQTNGDSAFINSTNAITLAAVNLGTTGNFSLASSGAVAQSAALTANTLNVSTTGGASIALNNAANSVASLSVTTNGGAASIVTAGSVAITGANLTSSGNFSLTAAGAVTQTGAITSSNLTVATTGDITLANAANAINGPANFVVTAGTSGASFTNAISTIIGNIDVQNGGLTVNSSGAIALTGSVLVNGSSGQTVSFNALGGSIGQTSGTITVSGVTNFKAFAVGPNNLLTSANNNISAPISLYGQNISFVNSTAITLAGASLDGSGPASSVSLLSLGGSISQTGAILTANLSATSQAAAGGTITLNNGGNTITGLARFSTTFGDVTFDTASTVSLGNSSVTGNLYVTSTNGQILVADPGGGAVQASASIILTASSDVVQGTSYSTGNPGSLVTASRIPLQPGVGASLSVSSNFGDIQLDATNVVTGPLTLSSTGNISFTNQSGITVAAGAGGSIGIATTGSIGNISAPATVSLTSVDGNIDVQGSITANGTITLGAPNGTVSLEGPLNSVTDNTIALIAGSGISQAGGTITAGNLKATTQNGGITLTAANNRIYSFIDMQAPGNISLVNSVNTYVDTIGNGLVPTGGVYSAPAAAASVTLSAPNIYPNSGGGYGIAASSITLTAGLATGGGSIGCTSISVCEILQPLMISGGFAGTNPDSAAASLTVSTNGGNAYFLSRSPVTIAGSGINLNSNIVGYPGGALYLSSYGGVNVYGPVSTSGNVIDIDSGGPIQVNMPISAAAFNGVTGAILLTANDHNLNSIDAGIGFNSGSNGIAGLSTLAAGVINLTADFGLATGQGGGIGTQAQPLQVSSDTGSLSLALHTFNGNVYISSPVAVSIDNQSSVLGQFGTGGPPLAYGATGINTLGNTGLYGQMSLTVAGPVNQTYGIQSGNLTVTATGTTGSINLTDTGQLNDPGNSVFGTIHLNSAGDADYASGFANLIATNFGASTVSGNLTVVSSDGDLNIADPNGAAVNVTGATTLTASTGFGISVLSPLISGSNIVLIAGRDIYQGVTTGSTDVHIQTGGTLLASAGTGSISLMDLGHGCSSGSGCTADVGNEVTGSVQLNAAGNVAFANVPGVTIATSTTLGQFLVETPGNITIAPGASIQGGGSVGSTSSVGSVGSPSSAGSVGSPSSAGSTSAAAIVLAAGGNFINNSGLGQSTLLPATGGVFNIYSQAPTGDTFGGLNSNDQAIWGATYAVPVTVSGNRYIFAYQPTLTVAVNGNAGKVYGVDATNTVAQIGYSITGLQPGVAGAYLADTAASIYGTVTAVSIGAAAKASVGTYAITVSNLGVADGYALSVQGGTLTVTPAALTYLATAESRNAGAPNPAFSGIVTGFVNGDTLASATTGTLVFSSTATATSSAGSYAIDGSGLSATNYVFVQSAANATALTVVAPPITGATPVLTGFTAAIQPPLLNPVSTPLGFSQLNLISLPVVPPPPPPPPSPPPPPVSSPLADNSSEQPTSSDQTTSQVADSLDGNDNPPTDNSNGSRGGGGVVIPRMLVNSHTPPPPPTDISALSSFGNSSLWQ